MSQPSVNSSTAPTKRWLPRGWQIFLIYVVTQGAIMGLIVNRMKAGASLTWELMVLGWSFPVWSIVLGIYLACDKRSGSVWRATTYAVISVLALAGLILAIAYKPTSDTQPVAPLIGSTPDFITAYIGWIAVSWLAASATALLVLVPYALTRWFFRLMAPEETRDNDEQI